MRLASIVLSVALIASAGLASADQLRVQAGTTYALGSGKTQLNCGTLTVNGTLRGQAGIAAGLGNVQIVGGLVDGGAATFLVSGTWNNAGTFEPGTSTVRMTNVCTSALTITGPNRFCVLEVDAPGATLTLPAGLTQATCRLVLKGNEQAPLNIVSAGRSSRVCAPEGGMEVTNVTMDGSAVTVSDCVPQVPVGGPWVLALLMLGLAGLGGLALQRRQA